MLRVTKKLFIPLLILSIAFSSIICCCLPRHAEARPTEESNCHSHNSQDHDAPHHKCECPNMQGTLAKKDFDILKAVDVVLFSLSHPLFPQKTFLSFVSDNSALIKGHSPPTAYSLIPLYIKNCIFRI